MRKYHKWTQGQYEEFVIIWQSVETIQEVADHFNLSKQTVQNKACNLRKKDVPLKKHPPSKPRLDYETLIEIAVEYHPDEVLT